MQLVHNAEGCARLRLLLIEYVVSDDDDGVDDGCRAARCLARQNVRGGESDDVADDEKP
ncbi:MAG: hypothetical protein V3U38_06190 [Gemmatimonadota bacterium]